MKAEPDFTELSNFVQQWKVREQERTGYQIEICFDVKIYEQGKLFPALRFEVNRV